MHDHKSPLISLKSYTKQEELSPFLAIEMVDPSLAFLQSFTPHVMQWSENLWLFDLSFCRRFWQAQALSLAKTPSNLIEEILKTAGKDYSAVLAPHPWQAIFFMLSHLEQKPGLSSSPHPLRNELITLSGPFGQALYQQGNWEAWFAGLRQLAKHIAVQKRKHFHLNRFQSQIAQMQHAMKRLKTKDPHALKAANYSAIKRRFGVILADVWQWTFPCGSPSSESSQPLFAEEGSSYRQDRFPWIPWQPPLELEITRHLEEPLNSWEQCEAYLQEDFNRLCQRKDWSRQERVIALEWEITFYHMQTLSIPINFRNPHSLHQEEGPQTTALTQAKYAFEKAMQKLAAREDDLDLPADIPLLGWRIIIKQKLVLPPLLQHLFSSLKPEQSLNERLLAIENKLPVSLETYCLCPNFYPQEAYASQRQGEELTFNELALWEIAACERPLFIYRQPQLMPKLGYSTRRQFLERTHGKWWQEPSNSPGIRDYYLLIDHEHRAHWVFHDYQGYWYKHGIYS